MMAKFTKHKEQKQSEERRRFFRINDEVSLLYKKVDPDSVSDVNYVSDEILNSCSIAAAMDMMDQEAQLILHRLESNNPDVAAYLKVMDDKINLIARVVLIQGTDLSVQETRNANISASGIAFESKESLHERDYLEIKMFLTSCMAVIVTYAKVIYCKTHNQEDSEYQYQIGVDYINMKDQDRELLIKHIVKRQIQQIRDQKEL